MQQRADEANLTEQAASINHNETQNSFGTPASLLSGSGWAIKKKKKNRMVFSEKGAAQDSSLKSKLISISSHTIDKPGGLQADQFIDLPDSLAGDEDEQNAVSMNDGMQI